MISDRFSPTSAGPKLALVVLGMHRSGTSSLSGVLAQLGAQAPKALMESRPDNQKGHWESERIAELNDRILASAGSHWHDWRAFNARWAASPVAAAFRAEAVATIVNEFDSAPMIVLKDPRICRFFPFWRAALKEAGYETKVLMPVRMPLEVAQSLRQRNGFSVNKGLLLWLRHALDAEAATRTLPRAVLLWDSLLADWRAAVERIGDELGLQWPMLSDYTAERIDDFLSAQLRHQVVSPESFRKNPEVHQMVADAYDAFAELAREPGSNQAIKTLDDIRAEFDRGAGLFGRSLATLEIDVAKAKEQAASENRTEVEGLRIQISRLETDAAAANAAHQAEMAAVHASHAESLAAATAAAVESELGAVRQSHAEAEARGRELAARVEQMEAEASARDAALVQAQEALAAAAANMEHLSGREQEAALETSRLRGELDSATAQSADLSGRLEDLAGRLASSSRDAEEALAAARMAHEEAQRLAEERSRQLQDAAAQIASAEQDRARLQHEADLLAAAHERERAVREEAQRLAEERSSQLKEAAAQIASAEQDRARLQHEADLLAAAHERERAVRIEAQQLMEERSRQLQDAAAQIASEAMERARLEQERELLTSARARERAAVDELAGHAVRSEREAFAAQSTVEALREEVRILRAQAERQASESAEQARLLAAYRDSTSWKIAAPVRWLKAAPASVMRTARALPVIMGKAGGLKPAAAKAVRIVRTEGLRGIGRRAGALSRPAEPAPPAPIAPAQPAADPTAGLAFEAVGRPEVSIIIPVYNAVAYTVACLRSLAALDRRHSFEIIVMDDGSSDETGRLISAIPGVRYIRNETNLGFLRNCNKGASLARGAYLVFLNNDTVVEPNWLHELRATFDEDARIGLVGSKLIYPDGRLQEAGGIIWDDASGWNWGRLADPQHPAYCYTRDVDYVSGASIMIQRHFFLELGRFDERYEFAYYEDTDLAMAVRAAGRRVVMQPFSRVTHYEGITSGTDESSGAKRFQAINRTIFHEKWRETLAGNLPNGSRPFEAADRSQKRVLLIDACTPTPDRDAGSVNMLNFIRILRSLDYRVHFIPLSNFAHMPRYTEALQRLGVECVYAPYYANLDQFLSERGDCFDHVIMARVDVAHHSFGPVKHYCARARTCFYTVDLHFLRELREAELTQDPAKLEAARVTEQREIAMMQQVDVTVVLSDAERKLLAKRKLRNIAVVPLINDLPPPTPAGFEERSGVLFIGGYQHTPNVDAVEWLVKEIWPALRQIRAANGSPMVTLRLYGADMPAHFASYAAPDIEVCGYVEDLAAPFSQVRLSLAPLRFGAGLKGKIASSLGFGVPVVGTKIAFEGMRFAESWTADCISNSAQGLARKIAALYDDEPRWRALRDDGIRSARNAFGLETISAQVAQLLEPRAA